MTFDSLVRRITDRPQTSRRFVVAIAGPPAAGKTTMAADLNEALSAASAVLGMDAFHFDDAILNSRGHRTRKGAPFTFDVQGYRRCLETLIHETDSEVTIPVFDRDLELSRNCAVIVPPSCEIIITEGNYLLLDDDTWGPLAPLFDLTVFLEVDLEIIRQRIMERWRQFGFSIDEAERRANENDLPNAQAIVSGSRTAGLTIHNG